MQTNMKLQIALLVVLCAGVHSLPAAQEHKIDDSKIDRDIRDDRRGLEIDWTAFAQELAERNNPTPLPTKLPSPKPTHRSGSWGIVTRVPTIPTEQSESSVITPFPTKPPSRRPTPMPTSSPSGHPTLQPSVQPTSNPSLTPSSQPTSTPSVSPSASPTLQPSVSPSEQPTSAPSAEPSVKPTTTPSLMPSSQPTSSPSASPSSKPSSSPSSQPTNEPSASPSASPTFKPSAPPSRQPTTASSSIQATAAGDAEKILSSEENNNEVQVSLEAGTRSNGVTFTLVGSAVVIIIGVLFVKRGCILRKEEAEHEEEEGKEEEEQELPNISDMEEGHDNGGRRNITYPVPPSAAIDTRTYKTRPPLHILTSPEQSNNLSPIR